MLLCIEYFVIHLFLKTEILMFLSYCSMNFTHLTEMKAVNTNETSSKLQVANSSHAVAVLKFQVQESKYFASRPSKAIISKLCNAH